MPSGSKVTFGQSVDLAMGVLRELHAIEGHTERAWSVAWHPTASVLASCSSDKSIRLVPFGLAHSSQHQHQQNISFKQNTSTSLPLSHSRTVRALSWSPNGAMLATASFDSTVGIWERLPEEGIDDSDAPAPPATGSASELTEHWENVSGLEGHENEVKSVCWSASGSLLATCGRDKSVWIWECTDPAGDAEFECAAVLMDHAQDVKQIQWHPNADVRFTFNNSQGYVSLIRIQCQLLASASYDDTIRIFQPDPATDDWSCTHILPPPSSKVSYHGPTPPSNPGETIPFSQTGHTSTVWSIAFNADGCYIASCSEDCTIRIWKRNFIEKEKLPDINTVFRIGAADKERWDCVALLQGHFERAIYSIDWDASTASEDSLGWIAATGSEGKLVVFDIKVGLSLPLSRSARENRSNRIEQPPKSAEQPILEYSVVGEIEDGHGISDINCVRWCSSKPWLGPLPQSSDAEEDRDGGDEAVGEVEARIRSDREKRWTVATKGVLATAGDDGLVKIWQLES